MDAGLHIVTLDWTGGPSTLSSTLARTARLAEDAGFRYITMTDHFLQAADFLPAGEPLIEGYCALSFLAAHTERVILGMLVSGVTYRNPGVLAKTVTTLDVLSRGRGMLGIGAAWNEREHRSLGLAFPDAPERLVRLEEAIRICLKIWSQDDGPFIGPYHHLAETLASPATVSNPHPPIMVAGAGEKRTLQIVARYADLWNIAGFSADIVRSKLDVLKVHCENAGRDIDDIRKTILWISDPLSEPEKFLSAMEAYEELGFDTMFVTPHGPDPYTTVEQLAGLLKLVGR